MGIPEFETQTERVEYLIGRADPAGEARPRLETIRGALVLGKLLSSGDRRFVQACVDRLDDIECENINGIGLCLRFSPPIPCRHPENQATCTDPGYRARRPERKRRFFG